MFLRERDGEGDLGGFAAYDDLARAVEIRHIHVALGCESAHGAFITANHRSHSAAGGFASFLHEEAALGDESQAGFEIERARGRMGGKCTERKASGSMNGKLADIGAERREAGKAVEEKSGLAVFGLREFLGWTFDSAARERAAENGVAAFEYLTGSGAFLHEVLAHSDLLGALPGEKKSDAFVGH